MSVNFLPLKSISITELITRCEGFQVVLIDGVLRHPISETQLMDLIESEEFTYKFMNRLQCTDGKNYLCMDIRRDGTVNEFIKYSTNDPQKILDAIENIFDTVIVDEYDERY